MAWSVSVLFMILFDIKNPFPICCLLHLSVLKLGMRGGYKTRRKIRCVNKIEKGGKGAGISFMRQ